SKPTTPVCATPVCTSKPNASKCSATTFAVRNSRLLSSGCWCKSRRHSITFCSSSALIRTVDSAFAAPVVKLVAVRRAKLTKEYFMAITFLREYMREYLSDLRLLPEYAVFLGHLPSSTKVVTRTSLLRVRQVSWRSVRILATAP